MAQDFRARYAQWQGLQDLFPSRAEWWEEIKKKVKAFFITA